MGGAYLRQEAAGQVPEGVHDEALNPCESVRVVSVRPYVLKRLLI